MRIFHLKCSTSTYSLPHLAALHGRQCTSDSGSTNILGGASLASGVSGAGASAGSRNRNVSGPVTHPETQPTSRETNPGRRSSEDRDSWLPEHCCGSGFDSGTVGWPCVGRPPRRRGSSGRSAPWRPNRAPRTLRNSETSLRSSEKIGFGLLTLSFKPSRTEIRTKQNLSNFFSFDQNIIFPPDFNWFPFSDSQLGIKSDQSLAGKWKVRSRIFLRGLSETLGFIFSETP